MSAQPPDTGPLLDAERYELTNGPSYRFELQRRDMLKVVGGGLLVGVVAGRMGLAQESGGPTGAAPEVRDDVGAWVHVDEQGGVAVFTGKAELGQNIRTSLSQAVADELRVAADTITVVMADTARTPFDAGTFGSRTTPHMAPQLRRAAAAARAALVDLAAARWQVNPLTVEASDGRVRHTGSGRSIGYGELTRGQKLARVVGDAPPLARAEWRLAGTSLGKVNGRSFVTGQHEYVSDITRPQMRHGVVLRPTSQGAALTSMDIATAGDVSGARVVRDGDFIGVTAPDAASARRAASLVRTDWRTPTRVRGDQLFEHLRQTADSSARPQPVHESGSVDEGRRLAARTVEATYTVPYIAHVPLEPRAAVAEWGGNGLTVWTGTQRPFGVRRELADAFHVPLERVRVLVPDTGSAYGGKHTGEAAIEAARLAKAAGCPVKVTWTREEEFTNAYFRPAGVIDVRSGLDAEGGLVFWSFDNINSGTAAIRTPYEVPHQRIAFRAAQSPLRQGSYRALAATANNFARECQMDELAELAGFDAVEFRLRHLKDPRLRGVLHAAADRVGWGRTTPGASLGIACGFEKGGYVATAAALSVESGRIVLQRIVCAFDCGAIVNPRGLQNQVEGALVQGIGGALFEAVEFADSRITNGRLSQYRVPRFADVPQIEIVSVEPAGAASAGAGETPIIALAPAVAGAVFRATGRRLRGLPLGAAIDVTRP